VVVAPDSWKAKHIALTGKVAMTVPMRRGGLLSLGFPDPASDDRLSRDRDRPPPGLDRSKFVPSPRN
jgi:hypothetical protein